MHAGETDLRTVLSGQVHDTPSCTTLRGILGHYCTDLHDQTSGPSNTHESHNAVERASKSLPVLGICQIMHHVAGLTGGLAATPEHAHFCWPNSTAAAEP